MSIRYIDTQRQDLLTETKWFTGEDIAKDKVLYNNEDFDSMSYMDVDALFKTLTPPNIIKDLSGTTAPAKDANYFNIALNAEELNINFQRSKNTEKYGYSTNRIPQSLSEKTRSLIRKFSG